MAYPKIIQGGMGAGVSGWLLARTVSETGQLGVVSGTAQDEIMIRHLQKGDPGGHYRHALEHFPIPEISRRIIDKYFIPGGKPADKPFKQIRKFTHKPSREIQEITVAGNFAEVFLAKEGHKGVVGINLLEKILLPNIYSLYGAMLAGVDYVIMGAGIPREIPGVLDKLSAHEPACLRLLVEGATSKDNYKIYFDPKKLFGHELPPLKRPLFLGIIASVPLAQMLAKKASGKIDGFVIEGHVAGGHNAPPRGKTQLSESGEPVYGDRDKVDLDKIKDIGLPFWLAGSYGSPDKLQEALDAGAEGIQVGTAFAFAEESCFSNKIKESVIPMVLNGGIDVFTDPKASPSGFPFKVLSIKGTLSDEKEYLARKRYCDQGYLRHIYKKPDGSLGYRCPSEPVGRYLKKGGKLEDTKGRVCLCNALIANLDIQQVQQGGYVEQFFVTSGNDISYLPKFIKNGNMSYSAKDVLEHLLS